THLTCEAAAGLQTRAHGCCFVAITATFIDAGNECPARRFGLSGFSSRTQGPTCWRASQCVLFVFFFLASCRWILHEHKNYWIKEPFATDAGDADFCQATDIANLRRAQAGNLFTNYSPTLRLSLTCL